MKIRPTGFVFPAREPVELTDENFKEYMADDLARPYWTSVPSAKDVANELISCVYGIERTGGVLIRVPHDVYLSLNALTGTHLDLDNADTVCPPTQWAYEQACRTIDTLRADLDESKSLLRRIDHLTTKICAEDIKLPFDLGGMTAMDKLEHIEKSTGKMTGLLLQAVESETMSHNLKKLASLVVREAGGDTKSVHGATIQGLFKIIEDNVPKIRSSEKQESVRIHSISVGLSLRLLARHAVGSIGGDTEVVENAKQVELIEIIRECFNTLLPVPPMRAHPGNDVLGYTLMINFQEGVDSAESGWIGRVLELPDVTEFSTDRDKVIELLHDTIYTSREMCRDRSIHFPDPLLYPQEHEDTVMPLGFVYKMMAKLKKNIGRWPDADWQKCTPSVFKDGMNNPDPVDRANFSAMYDYRNDGRGGTEVKELPPVPPEKVREMHDLFGGAFDRIAQRFEGRVNTDKARYEFRDAISRFLFAMVSQGVFQYSPDHEETKRLISKVAEEVQRRVIPHV